MATEKEMEVILRMAGIEAILNDLMSSGKSCWVHDKPSAKHLKSMPAVLEEISKVKPYLPCFDDVELQTAEGKLFADIGSLMTGEFSDDDDDDDDPGDEAYAKSVQLEELYDKVKALKRIVDDMQDVFKQ